MARVAQYLVVVEISTFELRTLTLWILSWVAIVRVNELQTQFRGFDSLATTNVFHGALLLNEFDTGLTIEPFRRFIEGFGVV